MVSNQYTNQTTILLKEGDRTPIIIPPTRESVTASDHFPRRGIHAPTGTSSHAKDHPTSERSLREGPIQPLKYAREGHKRRAHTSTELRMRRAPPRLLPQLYKPTPGSSRYLFGFIGLISLIRLFRLFRLFELIVIVLVFINTTCTLS